MTTVTAHMPTTGEHVVHVANNYRKLIKDDNVSKMSLSHIIAGDAQGHSWWLISSDKHSVYHVYCNLDGSLHCKLTSIDPSILLEGPQFWYATTFQQRLDIWLENLRNGEFKQGREKLQDCGKYCCLGVGTRLLNNLFYDQFSKHCLTTRNIHDVFNDSFIKNCMLLGYDLEHIVQQYYGIRTSVGTFVYDESYHKMLDVPNISIRRDEDSGATIAYMNDSSVPFEKIAKLIEFKPKGLFAVDF